MYVETVKVPVRAVTTGPGHYFFGYYDKCPWDLTGRYLLSLQVKFKDTPPRPGDQARIGVVDLCAGDKWIPIAETSAWCWQQGCMLQWMGNKPEPTIIYNDYQNSRLVSVIKNIRSGETCTLPRPVYAISHDGNHALSLNFSGLAT